MARLDPSDLDAYTELLDRAQRNLSPERYEAIRSQVAEAITAQVPFAMFERQATALPMKARPPIAPEIVEQAPGDLEALDVALATAAERVKKHTTRTGILSRWQLARDLKSVSLLGKYLDQVGAVSAQIRRIQEERMAIERLLAHANASSTLHAADVQRNLAELEASIEQARARTAEARQRTAIAEDTAKQFAGTSRRRKELPSMTVRDLQKKSGNT